MHRRDQACNTGCSRPTGRRRERFASLGGLELWKTDGTNQGTLRVADIKAGAASSNPCYLTVVNGRLFFAADGDSVPGGVSLWSSDGSAAGTKRVTSAPLVSPHALISYNGLLYFIAGDPTHGEQLWTSDGTEAGTVPVTQILPESVYPDSGSLLVLSARCGIQSLQGRPPDPERGSARNPDSR